MFELWITYGVGTLFVLVGILFIMRAYNLKGSKPGSGLLKRTLYYNELARGIGFVFVGIIIYLLDYVAMLFKLILG